MINASTTPPPKAGDLYIAGKIDFNVNTIKRQKTVITKRYKKKFITTVNIYTSSQQKLTELNREIYTNTNIVGDINTPLSQQRIYHPKRIIKETVNLNKRSNSHRQNFLSNNSKIYILLKHKQYIFHRTSLNKHKKTEITLNILYDHNGMKLNINNRKKKNRKLTTTRKLNNTLLNN